MVDLYAGVGLFGLALAALGHDAVTLVEGDRVSGASLVSNATPFSAGVQVQRMSVEQFLAADRSRRPRRNGHRRSATDRASRRRPRSVSIKRRPRGLVYVSCDVATLARDARALVDAGYALESVRGFDLFPNTAHVESVSLFRMG